jgi:hypothetical protein
MRLALASPSSTALKHDLLVQRLNDITSSAKHAKTTIFILDKLKSMVHLLGTPV